MKVLPPNGRQLVIPRPIRLVMLYVGSPQCWQAAKNSKQLAQQNHLVLPLITDAKKYHWPVHDCPVVVIDFDDSALTDIGILIGVLLQAGARSVDVKQINKPQTIRYQRPEKGGSYA